MPQLPTEIITQILLSPVLSILDIRTVSRANRRMRQIVANKSFGKRFLQMDFPSLSLDISVETDVSTFDVLYFGISHPAEQEDKENQPLIPAINNQSIFLVQVAPESQHVKILTWNLSASGRIRSTAETDSTTNVLTNSWRCGLWKKTRNGISPTRRAIQDENKDLWNNEGRLAVHVRDSHREHCRVCSTVNAQWAFEPIDKNYRVFLRSWSDSLSFKLPSGAMVSLNIANVPKPTQLQNIWTPRNSLSASSSRMSSAGFSLPAQQSTLTRYGLFTSQKAVKAVERFFDFLSEEDELETEDMDVVSLEPEGPHIKTYNPWM
ncbi:UNVERIFIED_CONTAM: hypothetical protein HDU68_000201 [Siphonaria sp. JEL0065]|nr:hypothetical protein HDU68_000201 [Siphonaria sp. JEL0065]